MKRITPVLVLMIVSLLIFATCSKHNGSTMESDKNTGISQVEINSSTDNNQLQSSENENNFSDFNNINVTYTFVNLDLLTPWIVPEEYSHNYHPVSYTVDGQQFRRTNREKKWGTNGYYPEVDYDAWSRKDAVNLYAKDYYHPESTGYDKLGDAIVVKTNGDWDVFSANVKYIDYRTEINKIPHQKWIDFFAKELQNLLGVKTPVIISHAWLFTYNGMECAIVEANNIDKSGKETSTTLPASNDNYAYRITGIFIGERQPIVDSYKEFYIYKEPMNRSSYPDNINCSFVSPTSTSINDEDFGIYYFNTWQYNRNGNAQAYSIYGNWAYGDNDANIIQCIPKFFIGDVDGDGKVEIVRENNWVSSLGHHIQVYDITDNGIERR